MLTQPDRNVICLSDVRHSVTVIIVAKQYIDTGSLSFRTFAYLTELIATTFENMARPIHDLSSHQTTKCSINQK